MSCTTYLPSIFESGNRLMNAGLSSLSWIPMTKKFGNEYGGRYMQVFTNQALNTSGYPRLTAEQVRDQQTSAALGLPPRIRDEDCEIAELEHFDFEESGPVGPSEIFKAPPDVHVSYVIGMAQLARLCMRFSHIHFVQILNNESLVREVVSSQYLPGRSRVENPSRPMLHQSLIDWESNLPKEMQFQSPMSREAMFLVGMLHMAYKYVQ